MTDIENAELVLPTQDIQKTASYFIDRLGFKLQTIYPADAPRSALLTGDGTRIRLEIGRDGDPGRLSLRDDGPSAQPVLPPAKPEVLFTAAAAGPDVWQQGRAGMQYRDMLPGRWGGHFIVSHIRIPDGGPVPDYVHYHQVRFQMIYCLKGWVRVVYEDQGEPFVMEAGDCVLQPPEIRHRVLESSDGLEVLEIGCPAEHPTLVEHEINLPTGRVFRDRDFGGQLFLRHIATAAVWRPLAAATGWSECDLGMTAATKGFAGLTRMKTDVCNPLPVAGAREFTYLYCLAGNGSLSVGDLGGTDFAPGAGFALPAGKQARITPAEGGCDLLHLTI